MRTNKSLIVWIVCLSFLLLLVVPHALKILGNIFVPRNVSLWHQLGLFKWLAAGCAVYAVIHRYITRNILWLETFSHELIHTVVALLTLRRVHSFQASLGEGLLSSSGRRKFTEVLVTLAPYCLPIYTYALLFIRPLIVYRGLWFYDLLIGITLCFHIICFMKQTRRTQPDIYRYPLGFSYLYIITAHIVNGCIILGAFFDNAHVFSSFWELVCALWRHVLNWLAG